MMAKWQQSKLDGAWRRPGAIVRKVSDGTWLATSDCGTYWAHVATAKEGMDYIDSVLDGDEKHSGGILESASIMPPHAATMAYARNPEKPMDVERRVDSMMADGLKVAEEMEDEPLPAGWQEIRPGWFDHISAGHVQRLPNGMWRAKLNKDGWHPSTIGRHKDFTDASSAMHWVEMYGSVEGEVVAGTYSAYASLSDVLNAAYRQASEGKGRERHANDLPFEQQPIMAITREDGLGFPLGQVRKKSLEATGMARRGDYAAAEAELLGAIVYTAAAVMRLRELAGDDDDFEDVKIGGSG